MLILSEYVEDRCICVDIELRNNYWHCVGSVDADSIRWYICDTDLNEIQNRKLYFELTEKLNKLYAVQVIWKREGVLIEQKHSEL